MVVYQSMLFIFSMQITPKNQKKVIARNDDKIKRKKTVCLTPSCFFLSKNWGRQRRNRYRNGIFSGEIVEYLRGGFRFNLYFR